MGERADSRVRVSESSPGGMPAGDTLLGGPAHIGPPPDDLPEIAMRPAWASRDRVGAYQELEHPADLLLQITGRDLATLFENALFAFYDQVAELGGFRADREVVITVWGASPSDGLRELLSEALFRFETERFVAVGAQVTIESTTFPEGTGPAEGESGAGPGADGVTAVARLWGENATRDSRALGTEIKAVTYHRLALERTPGGAYRATVLFDV
jgi:SHS2 domain-containing protein